MAGAQNDGSRPLIFIGHADEDRAIVAQIVGHLEADGMDCWVYWRDQTAGHDYADSIVDAIERSSAFLLAFSHSSANSAHCYSEYVVAQNQAKPSLIIKLDDTEPSGGWRFWFAVPHWLQTVSPIGPHLGAIEDGLRRLLSDSPMPLSEGVAFEATATAETHPDTVQEMLDTTIVETDDAAPDQSQAAALDSRTVIVDWGGDSADNALIAGPGSRRANDGGSESLSIEGALLLETFLVHERIGTGGTADIYRGADTILQGRAVAIKILNPRMTGNPRVLQRFEREARLLCGVRHRYIPAGIAMGMRDGRPFIVMEYSAGSNLRQLLARRGPLDPALAIHLAREVALALEQLANVEGFRAHRDVKPANVLVREDGSAQLADFGNALWEGAEEQPSSFIGSPNYMSPEQILNPSTVGFAADVYGLGATMYEMLTAKKAYPGRSTKDILDAHFGAGPIPQVRRPGRLTALCNEALTMMLAPAAADRFQTARDLVAFLDD